MNQTPRIIGRYAVFDPIASGGMASVHLGRLMGAVGFSRTVAIKRLHESFAADPEFVAMFLDEARIVARIRHPNVVPTLDVVASDHDLLLVMEYIVGESLQLLLTRARKTVKPPPIPIVVDIVASVLSGLHAAHTATNEKGEALNIVHRDVSPQNILVGADGVARVLDFGVAKAVGRMQQTRPGEVKGKVRYMSPEQLLGKGVTPASDVYSASIVLWEALTGERLFKGNRDVEVMYHVLEGHREKPSRFRSDITPELDEVVLRGLEADPANRYSTAKAMACALEAAVEPVTRRAVSLWVLETAGEDIQRRQDRVAEVESKEAPTGARSAAALLAQTSPVAHDSTPRAVSLSSLSDMQIAAPGKSRLLSKQAKIGAGVALVATVAIVATASFSLVGRSDDPARALTAGVTVGGAQPSVDVSTRTAALPSPLPLPSSSTSPSAWPSPLRAPPLAVASETSGAHDNAPTPARKVMPAARPAAMSPRPSSKPPAARPGAHDLNSLLDSR